MSLNTFVERLLKSHQDLSEDEARKVGARLFWALLGILALGYIVIVSIAGYTSSALALMLAVVYSFFLLWFFDAKMRDAVEDMTSFKKLKFVSKLRYFIFILDIVAVIAVLLLKQFYLL